MQPHRHIRGESTPAEEREASTLALKLMETVKSASSPKVALAAAGFFLRLAFSNYVKREHRVNAFEDFGFWTRRDLIEETRHDSH